MRCSSSTTKTFTARLPPGRPAPPGPGRLQERQDEHGPGAGREARREGRSRLGAARRRRPPRRRAGRRGGVGTRRSAARLGIIEARRGYYDRLREGGGHDEENRDSLAAAAAAAAALLCLGLARAPKRRRPTAMAMIESRSGSKVTGKAVFTELPSGSDQAEVWIENATPGTPRAAHPREGRLLGARRDVGRAATSTPPGNPHAAPDGRKPPQRRLRQHRDRRRRQGTPRDHDRHADRQAGPELASSARPWSSTRRPTT